MKIEKLGRCPRCGGNMLLEADLDGWYEECLQCSYWCELRDVAPESKREATPKQIVLTGSALASFEFGGAIRRLDSGRVRGQKDGKG